MKTTRLGIWEAQPVHLQPATLYLKQSYSSKLKTDLRKPNSVITLSEQNALKINTCRNNYLFAVNALDYTCKATYCSLVWVTPHVNGDIHAREFLLPEELPFGETGLLISSPCVESAPLPKGSPCVMGDFLASSPRLIAADLRARSSETAG